MKRILKITAEYVEECDWDNVGRPLDRLIDEGWKITRKKVIKND